MDQNTPRDEASGAVPPAEPGSVDATAWNQQPQAPAPNQPQAGAAPDQGAGPEQAGWSADAAYQQPQQQAQQPEQPAQQPQPPEQPAPSDTQAYAAPEPQSATYSEQPAASVDPQQQYQQQQQAYDQSAYGQQYPQQQAYDQSGYQQPQQPQQPQQQAYDQSGYQQQQQYQQPQQPGYYDQSAYGQQYQQPYQQQGYYDQSGYGQQPQYYDQSAYGQAGYPQQPTQPYAYAQPGQEGWDQGETGYNRSFLAVLSGWILLTFGFVFGIVGAIVIAFNSVTDFLADVELSAEAVEWAEWADERIFAVGAIAIMIGIVHLIAAVGIFGHRRWGRAFGVVLGILGVLLGVAGVIVAAGYEALDVGLGTAIEGETASIAASLFVFFCYLFVLAGMLVGRRHFRKKGVES